MSLIVPNPYSGGVDTEYGIDVTSNFYVGSASSSKLTMRNVKYFRYGDLISLVFNMTLKAGTHPKDEYDEIICRTSEMTYFSAASMACAISNFWELRFGGGITNLYTLVFTNSYTLNSDSDISLVTPPYFRYSVYSS